MHRATIKHRVRVQARTARFYVGAREFIANFGSGLLAEFGGVHIDLPQHAASREAVFGWPPTPPLKTHFCVARAVLRTPLLIHEPELAPRRPPCSNLDVWNVNVDVVGEGCFKVTLV